MYAHIHKGDTGGNNSTHCSVACTHVLCVYRLCTCTYLYTTHTYAQKHMLICMHTYIKVVLKGKLAPNAGLLAQMRYAYIDMCTYTYQ